MPCLVTGVNSLKHRDRPIDVVTTTTSRQEVLNDVDAAALERCLNNLLEHHVVGSVLSST